MYFSKKLMELRKSRGWSQEELGDKINVTRQTISKWELGTTTPELEKLIELSRLFGISIDELVNEDADTEIPQKEKESVPVSDSPSEKRYHYEYKSRTMIGNMPLVHINVGMGIYKAKGVIAVGNAACGLLSLGFVSAGVVSLGLFSLGLLAFGMMMLGALAAGGIAVGLLAFGGLSVGVMAVGGVAVGVYSVGGAAIGHNIALGGYASGHIAIGNNAHGAFEFITDENFRGVSAESVRAAIMQEFPNTPGIITDIFCSAVK